MIIDLKNSERETVPNDNGNVYIIRYIDDKNKIMYATIEPKVKIKVHTHKNNSEIMYFTKGKGKAYYDGKYETIEAGMCHYCPKGHTHFILNDSDNNIEFFAVVVNQ